MLDIHQIFGAIPLENKYIFCFHIHFKGKFYLKNSLRYLRKYERKIG